LNDYFSGLAYFRVGLIGDKMSVQGDFNEIPVIDLAPLQQEDADLNAVAQAVREAYTNVGFAYIINHGVSQGLIDGLFAASADFHALPKAEKMALEVNKWHRGFIPINTSTPKSSSIAKVTKPNQSESFMVMHDLADDDPDLLAGLDLAGPNQWPASLPHFKPAVIAYVGAMNRLARNITTVLEIALGAQPNRLRSTFDRPTTFLRMLYYPPQPPLTPEDVFGSAPHTDYGFITLLVQDEVGGLQVRNINGDWVDAPYMPGAFVMNAADILHRWSNGQFISTPHRVINTSGRSRFSNPFFFDPDMKAEIVPLESCIPEGETAAYEPIIYGDYLMARLRVNHDQHKEK
jgi:isopenicillin N synthase-like dioxygenase